MGAEEPAAFVSAEFEVFGNVQGLYFTKYCKELAEQLGVGGWVKNSKRGTIVGKIQGPKKSVDQLVDWMSKTGSPGCKIERCQISNWEQLAKLDYRNFSSFMKICGQNVSKIVNPPFDIKLPVNIQK